MHAKAAMQHKILAAQPCRKAEGTRSVHIISDCLGKLQDLLALLQPRCQVSCALLDDKSKAGEGFDAVVIAADLRTIGNIAALRDAVQKTSETRKRIFLIDQRTHLLVAQAYALGATRVLFNPVNEPDLLAQLFDPTEGETSGEAESDTQAAASAGALALAGMFAAVLEGRTVDVAGTQRAAGKIADSIAGDGLSAWLETVRRHHEGTYQHCLLVTGVAIDFGLSLGLAKADIQRLYSAAMFHDVGKAAIPVAVLDKPGSLDARERALVESHPVAGYHALRRTTGISAEVLDAVRHHHEYLDGSGYPDGLCAANITDMVRILTISDIFAALIEDRRYRPAMPRETAFEILCNMRGKLEEPLVNAFKPVALSR